MQEEILFREKQKFTQWWLWLILVGVNGFFLFGIFWQIIGGQKFGNKPMSDAGLVMATFFTIILTLLLINFRLETVIKNDGIYVRFFPLHIKFKHYTWENLTKSYVRKYSAILEYGGWGLKIGIFGKGTAYNVSGEEGLQLDFADKKRLLIGTKKPDQLRVSLHKIEQLKY